LRRRNRVERGIPLEPRIALIMPAFAPIPAPISTVVIVGRGNLGSKLNEALGRLPGLRRVVDVDPDSYDASNLSGQQILSRDVGRAKVLVQGRRLRAILPLLEIIPFVDDIANVPVGWLRGAILLGCVDSIHSRKAIGEAAWRAGALWMDGGIEPVSGLARVSVFVPGPEAPCFECGLDPEDYEALPIRHLCAAGVQDQSPSATGGSFNLGMLTAALMMMELENILTSGVEHSLAGRQIVLDARHHAHFVTRLTRNPLCRFHHQTPTIQALAGVTEHTPLRETLAAAQQRVGGTDPVRLSLPNRAFARAVQCPVGCSSTKLFALPSRLPGKQRRCVQCGRELVAAGFDCVEELTLALPASILRRPLRSLGLRAGDVLTAANGARELALEIPRIDGSLTGLLNPESRPDDPSSLGTKEYLRQNSQFTKGRGPAVSS